MAIQQRRSQLEWSIFRGRGLQVSPLGVGLGDRGFDRPKTLKRTGNILRQHV